MYPTLLRPKAADSPTSTACWAFYGATQAFEMLGLSFDLGKQGELIVDPAADTIHVRTSPRRSKPLRTRDLIGVIQEVTPNPPNDGPLIGCPYSLPVFGPWRQLGMAIGPSYGIVRPLGETSGLPFVTIEEDDDDEHAATIRFGCHFFATLGLYMSRFSWPANPGFSGFVRQVDDLWDALPERWRAVPVVSAYVETLANVLAFAYERLDLPLVTLWPHPVRDGVIMRNGLICTHDVDAVYADPSFREAGADQSDNAWFNFNRWRELESGYGVKSAFYLMAPKPGDEYELPSSYSISDPVVKQAAMALARDGWETSIHQLSYDDADALAREAEFFQQVTGHAVTGARNHHLRHAPAALRYKQQAGHAYDSTWYAETTDSSLLCGSVLPFRPLDCDSAEPLEILEFPFVIEDGIVTGCYGDETTARSIDGAIADGARILEQVIAYDGYACTNWHQRTFARMSTYEGAPDNWVPAWAGIVARLQEASEALWTPLPIELARWWNLRSRVRIEATPQGVNLRNESAEDIPDLALCLHSLREPSSDLTDLGRQGSRERRGLPLALAAGEHKEVQL